MARIGKDGLVKFEKKHNSILSKLCSYELKEKKKHTVVVMDGANGPKSPRIRLITPERTMGLISINSSSAKNSARWNESSVSCA